jgi:hypothetical protein
VLGRGLALVVLCATLLWVPLEAGWPQGKAPAPPAKDSAFTDRVASQLLDQLTTGLIAHNQSKMLGAFDLSKMPDGPLFRQQITNFFRQTGNIRFHFNILEVAADGSNAGRGTVEVAAEIDVEVLREAITPPLRKQATLHFVAESGPGGWKFTDVQPRTFFSTQP